MHVTHVRQSAVIPSRLEVHGEMEWIPARLPTQRLVCQMPDAQLLMTEHGQLFPPVTPHQHHGINLAVL